MIKAATQDIYWRTSVRGTLKMIRDTSWFCFVHKSMTAILFLANTLVLAQTGQYPADQWEATDALGRELPSFDDVGPIREGKIVGVFYYIWVGHHGDRVYDISQIIKQPEASRQWGPVNSFHFWGEPEYGYYRAEDPWVIRHDLQMLSNAKVDFIFFDVTNAITYLYVVRALCEVSRQMRAEGISTPQISFATNSFSGRTMNSLYDDFYSGNEYSELWFHWNGKPLMLGDINDSELRSEVKNFFTIKRSWVGSPQSNPPPDAMENHWPWLNWTPQAWGWSGDRYVAEQMSVSMAFHPANPRGQSWQTTTSQPPVDESYHTQFTGQGLHAQEQWEIALNVDPKVIMVTQWNEWIAQRFIWDKGDATYGGRPIHNGNSHFVDVFSQEFNRDMSPMKGGHTDNNYYQLVANIRKYKGMEPPQSPTPPQPIDIDGNFEQWNNVKPAFWDPSGDVMHRNYSGYDTRELFTNSTGRNDFVESRVTHDDTYLYFYAKTALDITPHTDNNWMMLFIDSDKSKNSGWQGYDYLVNQERTSENVAIIKKWQNNSWVNIGESDLRVSGKELELRIQRDILEQTSTAVTFYYKWADNIQVVQDIEQFFLHGDVAPDRRSNYHYSNSGTVIAPNTDPIEWTFNGSTSDWGPMNNLSILSTDGVLNLDITGVDPFLNSPDNLNIDASALEYLIVTMKNSSTDTEAQIYWSTNSDPNMSEPKSIVFNIEPQSEAFVSYVVHVGENSLWSGTIKRIRLDPVHSASSGNVEIQKIKIGSIPVNVRKDLINTKTEDLIILSAGKFSFSIAKKSDVLFTISDMRGRKIKSFYYESLMAGTHSIPTDISKLALGFYIVRVSLPNKVIAGQVIHTGLVKTGIMVFR